MIIRNYQSLEKCAVLTLNFKKGDSALLKNYRPISLTNTDYQLLTFIFIAAITTSDRTSCPPDLEDLVISKMKSLTDPI